MSEMEVSVVIAVYNAERFVARAIDTALAQDEVRELILVEDGSQDNSLQICCDYAVRDSRVKVFRHPNGENNGAGASFNLGIKHARYPFVAILGADDEFVPGRFASARRIFEAHPDADGAYAHIGVIYHDPDFKMLHLQRIHTEITGMHRYTKPEELLGQLLRGNKGHISLDSLVVRRTMLTGAFLFDETLRQGQDTDFMYRLASSFRLYSPQNVEIVALRGVHAENRVFRFEEAKMYQRQLLLKCIRNRFFGCRDRTIAKSVINRYLRLTWMFRLTSAPEGIKRSAAFLLFMVTHPRIAFSYLSLR